MRSPIEELMTKEIKKFFHTQLDEHELILQKTKLKLETDFIKLVNICVKSVEQKKKIIFFGNGGSAADSQHLATELSVRFSKNRKAIAALSLVTDTSTITAIANDFGFKYLFSRQIEAIGEKGDVAIGISTSGKSINVIEGLKSAKKKNLKCIIFTGKNSQSFRKFCDCVISIPAKNTSRIQEMHIKPSTTCKRGNKINHEKKVFLYFKNFFSKYNFNCV